MSIIYKKGDLLEVFRQRKVDCICHQTNAQGVMGSGIALQIKNKFPNAYRVYKEQEEKEGLILGEISISNEIEGVIFNLTAQNLYGYDGNRYVDYEALYECMRKTKNYMVDNNLSTIGLPYRMSCDRAGGSWTIVEAMLKVVFEENGINVVVVEYDPSV